MVDVKNMYFLPSLGYSNIGNIYIFGSLGMLDKFGGLIEVTI